ncbi:MAG: type II toxin-antitoxin system VapC family toxin [Deltaproteobacteria bacterium]|nr:type II toxin-antitoxin system VapC family toxin [Deltaproteobacteria bacterium]
MARESIAVVLDTCAIVWAVAEPKKLSQAARKLLEAKDTETFVSPISCAEVACAVARKKLALDRHWKFWFRHYVESNGWGVLPIDLDIIEEAYALPSPMHADPADRILVATARLHDCALLTADRALLAYPHVRAVW